MINDRLRHFAMIAAIGALDVVIGAGKQDLFGLGVLAKIKKPGDLRSDGLPALGALDGCSCHKIVSLSDQ